MKKALIAMSGGVDSSVVAHIAKEQGYDCTGMMMKLFENKDVCEYKEKSCCSLKDVDDARRVAQKLDIPFYVFNMSNEFRENVINRFVDSYNNGETPNPCIDCNKYIKFNHLLHKVDTLGFDYIITGHYAISYFDKDRNRYILKKSNDKHKDQTYVLYSLTQEQLKRTLFPLGDMEKTNVRKVAQEQEFLNANKKDSQDICFVTNGDYDKFIEEYTGKPSLKGEFIDTDGNSLGKHNGFRKYTIGQRKGIGISHSEPLFVIDKNPATNEIVVGTQEYLYKKELIAKNINLISVSEIDGFMRVKAKVRYKQDEQWASVEQLDADTIKVIFDEPQRAITKGQAVVMYDGDIVVGGGIIA